MAVKIGFQRLSILRKKIATKIKAKETHESTTNIATR
jgi:hypothetical protein